jgi:serine/threonine protein phosphatase PrpC
MTDKNSEEPTQPTGNVPVARDLSKEEAKDDAEVRCEAVAGSHIGRREVNEDAFLVDREHRLMVVADGVGGHQAGELASAITCTTLEREIAAGRGLVDSIAMANREVAAATKRDKSREGMATTVAAILMTGVEYELAWVGDSRVYLWDGKLKLLTRDHSLVETMLARGEITREEAQQHPQRNVIVQAVGLQSADALRIGENRGALRPGQMFLVCSDGVSDILDETAMALILQQDISVEARCTQMVSAAVGLGGQDNATAILISVDDVIGNYSDTAPDVVWQYDPAEGDNRARVLQPIELLEMELDSGQLSPEITQIISVKEVEREMAAQGQQRSIGGRSKRIRSLVIASGVLLAMGLMLMAALV